MAAIGVRVVRTDDTAKFYPSGRSFDFDGYGDLVVRNGAGDAIATRKRGSWTEIEIVDGVAAEAEPAVIPEPQPDPEPASEIE